MSDQAMKRNIKHHMKSQSEKATNCVSPTLQHSGKGKTMETVRRQVATRGQGPGGGCEQVEHRGSLGQ